ncbi:MAG: hypothetical protein ISS31_02565 [Kiritimatiellae bacterium]|nr:hypothetical protein [Kiritimatiellia bacterium]
MGLLSTTAWLHAADIEFHGFGEYRYGERLDDQSLEDDRSLNELRVQGDALWYHDLFAAQLKGDLVCDDVAADRDSIDLETGEGFFDLRQANILISPLSWMDLKAGRQVLTWGTGDLVFINDQFPKDWQSFFLGRDVEYLKAPSDALFVSMFPAVANIDVAYIPRFDADRHITGERLSYWNGQAVVGQDAVLVTDRPNDWFEDDEIAVRVYRNTGAFELALYGYHGYWKSPGGLNPATGQWIFPGLAVYGASARGPLGNGIMHAEAGYYDSFDDRDGNNPFINNSEARLLLGYEREIAADLTMGVQYYVERMLDRDEHIAALESMAMPIDTVRDEDRHTVTLRLTYLAMNQNLVLSCFTRYSPNEKDGYVKPTATYKMSDRWQATLGGNIFFGDDEHTFLSQFKDNNNVDGSVRLSF